MNETRTRSSLGHSTPSAARVRRSGTGYTLIELIVAVGLFALVMTLASGAYLLMISLNRQVQGIATGIDNLSFALDEMTRTIRTGSSYLCSGSDDCPSAVTSFTLTDAAGNDVTYGISGTKLVKTKNGVQSDLSDPTVTISSLLFYPEGTRRAPTDYSQARVKIVISGTVSAGPEKTESFTVETGSTMRGSDIAP